MDDFQSDRVLGVGGVGGTLKRPLRSAPAYCTSVSVPPRGVKDMFLTPLASTALRRLLVCVQSISDTDGIIKACKEAGVVLMDGTM